MEIKSTIEKLELKAGDILIVTVENSSRQEEIQAIGESIKHVLNEAGIDKIGLLVSGEGIDFAVYRRAD